MYSRVYAPLVLTNFASATSTRSDAPPLIPPPMPASFMRLKESKWPVRPTDGSNNARLGGRNPVRRVCCAS